MNNYNQIDLNNVKEKISSYAAIDDSKEYIMQEEISFNPLVIKRNINQTNEILNLLKKDYFISFDGIHNINDLLIASKKEVVLTSKECSEILNFHNHCKRIKNSLSKIDNELEIKDYTDSLFINDNLAKQINVVVDNNGNIKDDASSKLKEIINDILTNEKALNERARIFINKHQDSLQESTIFTRNGRVTFLIKNSDKNKFNGYTYGTSASGLASYVEPEGLIELNNKVLSLQEDKEDEIIRLLSNLTYLIAENADNYINNFDSIMKLDVVYAKAMFGFKHNGTLASLGEKLLLKDICHPLIDENVVVSNTYSLDKPYQGIVISGTNTGGKTVGLKTIGLSVLETYLGIPLLASEAIIPLYDNVYVDIDDNQSISSSLSTFSAHISNINNILNNATNKSLILIDELISGTDPKEAQAISLAILNRIENIGSAFIITTHYDDIKNYSYNNEHILLSSVGFDYSELKPTYKYIENSVGASNAIDIAERYFSDKSIIYLAKDFVKKASSKEDELMEKLAIEISKNEELKDSLNDELNKNIELNNQLEQKYKEFEKEKADLKAKYLDKLNNFIDEIKQKAIDKLDTISINNKNEKIIKEIEELKVDPIKEEVSFNIGDNVKVGTNDRIGKILEINNKKVLVDINGISIKTDIDNLTLMPKTANKVIKGETKKFKSAKKEINVVGKHIDEAIEEIEVYLDDALSANLEQVKIIHGIGTGQLRTAIRTRLKKMKFVKEFSDGDYYDGGSAVTMVKLK